MADSTPLAGDVCLWSDFPVRSVYALYANPVTMNRSIHWDSNGFSGSTLVDIPPMANLEREHAAGERPRSILHVDMDSFFASVEVRDGNASAGRPVAVVGHGLRGVVLSATYEARSFGLRAAMPVGQARRICPEAEFVAPRFAAYRRYSKAVMEILGGFSPCVEQASLDEAYIDVTGAHRLFGDSSQIAERMRARIAGELDLPASVGGGPNKVIAKLASDLAKPAGILIVEDGEVRPFLEPLDVKRLSGVGAATRKILTSMGIRKVGDIAATPLDSLVARLGESQGTHLHNLARGIDTRPVEPFRQAKSLSHERTFDDDLETGAQIERELLRISEELSRRLRRADLSARTFGLKLRLASMKTLNRSRTLDDPADSTPVISQAARELFEALKLDNPRVRLLGVSASALAHNFGGWGQLGLGDGNAPDWRAAERASDEVRSKFGEDAIGIASLRERRD